MTTTRQHLPLLPSSKRGKQKGNNSDNNNSNIGNNKRSLCIFHFWAANDVCEMCVYVFASVALGSSAAFIVVHKFMATNSSKQ